MHIQGPWWINGQFDSDVSVEVMSGDPKDEAVMVCEVAPYTGDWTEEEIANVRLISVAPELLEAAKLLIEGAESEGWDRARGTDEPRTGIAELRAAIAKAGGLLSGC